MTMIPIATFTARTSALSNVDFSNIPQTYTHLQVRYSIRDTGSFTTRGGFLEINGNSLSGNAQRFIKGNGSSASTSNNTNITRFDWAELPAANTASGIYGVGILDFYDYSKTNKFKSINLMHGYDANGSGEINIWNSTWASTNAINRIVIYTNTSLAIGSTMTLYGIPESLATGA